MGQGKEGSQIVLGCTNLHNQTEKDEKDVLTF